MSNDTSIYRHEFLADGTLGWANVQDGREIANVVEHSAVISAAWFATVDLNNNRSRRPKSRIFSQLTSSFILSTKCF